MSKLSISDLFANTFARLDEEPIFYTLSVTNEVIPLRNHDRKIWSTPRRILAQQTINDFFVSTVFLPTNLAWVGQPLHFETMVFDHRPKYKAQRSKPDCYCERTPTYNEAMLAHRMICERLRHRDISQLYFWDDNDDELEEIKLIGFT
jgi:hypothetical protein